MSETKPGMSSLNEDDMRRIAMEILGEYFQYSEHRIDLKDREVMYMSHLVPRMRFSTESVDSSRWQQDATSDQVECTDIQEEWVDSPTAD